jgi:hypothetical protein
MFASSALLLAFCAALAALVARFLAEPAAADAVRFQSSKDTSLGLPGDGPNRR